MTYLDPDHRPTRAGVAHARAELRPRRNSDYAVSAGWLVFAIEFVIAAFPIVLAAVEWVLALLLGDPGHGCCNTPGGTP